MSPNTVLVAIENAATLLCRDPLSAEQMAQDLGSVTLDHGGRLQIEVRPKDPRLAAAEVTRDWSTGEAAVVTLRLARPVSLDELSARFGAPLASPRLHPDDPEELIFTNVVRSGTLSCTLIVQKRDGQVVTVGLRRDKSG